MTPNPQVDKSKKYNLGHVKSVFEMMTCISLKKCKNVCQTGYVM